MFKKIFILSALIFIFLIGMTSAKTMTFTNNPNVDLNYTLKTPLTFNNGQFILNGSIRVTPFISIANRKYNLTSYPSATATTSIQDKLYKHKWSLNITKPQLISNFDYVGFDIIGCRKYDDYVLHCGNIELDFSDIANSNYTVDLEDTLVNITNPSMLSRSVISLDPTDTLIPSATNKAYKNTTNTATGCDSGVVVNRATTTEFTSTEYGKVNTSDDVRVQITAVAPKLTVRCVNYLFTFNTSSINISTITEVKLYHEGNYFENNQLDSFVNIYYYNPSTAGWVYWNTLKYDTPDGVLTYTFSSSFGSIIDANGIIKIGLDVAADARFSFLQLACTSNTDYTYVNVTYTSGEAATPITPEGDSFACNIPSFWGGVYSLPILCSAHSNTTGQPVTGATVTCTVHSSPYFTSTTQAVQTCGEQGNGMYNCTFLSANQVVNTPYIINCSASINAVVNWYMGVTYIMPAYFTDYATSSQASQILTNQSLILNNITLVNGNQTLILNNISLIQGNQTLILSNITLIRGNQTFILNNISLILGNDTDIKNILSYLDGNMSSNFTNTNNLISGITPTCNYNPVINNTYTTIGGENSTYNYSYTSNYRVILDRAELKNISKIVWELEPEQNLYYQWITYIFLIVLIIISLYFILKEWRVIR